MRSPTLLIAMILPVSPVYAYEYEGTQTMALSGAGRAQVTGNDALHINPAGLVWGKMYSLEASARDDLRGTDTWVNASIVDSQAGPIAGGIAYTYIDRTTEAGSKVQLGHQVDVAMATKISDVTAIGLTARYLKTDEDDGESDYELFTIDAGLQWRMGEALSLGLTAYNLTNSEHNTAPISWGAGLSYGSYTLGLNADVRYNAQIGKPKYLFGLAYLVTAGIPIRAGASYDLLDESVFISGGVGYQSSGFGVDLAYRQRIEQGEAHVASVSDRQLAASIRLTFF